MENSWTRRWRSTIRPTKYPNVWERKEGGYLIRALVTDQTTGRRREVKRVLPTADLAEALARLEHEKKIARGGGVPELKSRTRFADFAVRVYEHRVAIRKIVSEVGKAKWRYVLVHLIDGTRDDDGRLLVRGFGEFFVEQVRFVHIDNWKADVTTRLLSTGRYAPTTTNGWMATLKVIFKDATRKLELPRNPAADVDPFDTSEHHPYTTEESNSLAPAEVPAFLDALRRMYPQHYAMAVLGFVTGLRPSSLRPLRRSGSTPDLRWNEGVLEIRRSQTVGERVMLTTKTKRHQRIHLPPVVMDVLRWHVETQMTEPAMQESELLFPAVDGGFRTASVLNKPFSVVAAELGISKKFTQRGLRRTFQDLARTAEVNDLVTRSISGHATEAMQRHYSTVQADEQRRALARVFELASPVTPPSSAPPGEPSQP